MCVDRASSWEEEPAHCMYEIRAIVVMHINFGRSPQAADALPGVAAPSGDVRSPPRPRRRSGAHGQAVECPDPAARGRESHEREPVGC